MPDPFSDLDATAQAELVHTRQASPRELVDAAIARAERLDPALGFLVAERFERARAEASEASLPEGPFRGVPFLVKDLMCGQQGEPFAMSRALLAAGYRAPRDSHLAERFRAAGSSRSGARRRPSSASR
jgi:amidase